jgi:hypothetical protein
LGGSFTLHFNKDSCAKVSNTNHFVNFSGYLSCSCSCRVAYHGQFLPDSGKNEQV